MQDSPCSEQLELEEDQLNKYFVEEPVPVLDTYNNQIAKVILVGLSILLFLIFFGIKALVLTFLLGSISILLFGIVGSLILFGTR